MLDLFCELVHPLVIAVDFDFYKTVRVDKIETPHVARHVEGDGVHEVRGVAEVGEQDPVPVRREPENLGFDIKLDAVRFFVIPKAGGIPPEPDLGRAGRQVAVLAVAGNLDHTIAKDGAAVGIDQRQCRGVCHGDADIGNPVVGHGRSGSRCGAGSGGDIAA